MPGLDGWAVAQRLREAGFERLVIIMISAHAGALLRPAEEHPHHDDILAKPIDIPQLLAKISTHLAIEWTAQEEVLQDTASAGAAIMSWRLAANHAQELRELGAIGYVRGIHARLDSIERETPQDRDHIAQLRKLVSEFRLDAFMDALGQPQ